VFEFAPPQERERKIVALCQGHLFRKGLMKISIETLWNSFVYYRDKLRGKVKHSTEALDRRSTDVKIFRALKGLRRRGKGQDF